MEYFTLLGVATLVIAALAAGLYAQRRDAGLVVGIAALYYWSLYGAWSIVIDKTGGFSGQHYQYLESKMFPIALDGRYLLTLALYAGFIILVELTLLATLSRRRKRPIPRLVLRHDAILFAGFAAGLASYLVIRDQLNVAWETHTSAYWYTRSENDQWFTLHQVLNRMALIPPAIGLATLAAGRHSRFFVNVPRRYTWPAYLLLAAAMGTFTFVLGNKNEVFTALLTGVLAYAGSVCRPQWWRVGLVVAGGLWFLAAVDFFRATPLSGIGVAVFARGQDSGDVSHFVTTSNEAFAAHFSLYGVLAAGTAPKFGYSLYSLACSVIPRVLWPQRPRDIYLYYSESVGTIQNQGYSLHHATGWYLNFGFAGVALGAVALGLIWTACLNARQRIRRRSGLLYRLFAIIAPWVLVAGLPPLIRAGPEGYKGLVIESFLIPLAVLFGGLSAAQIAASICGAANIGRCMKPFLSVLIPCRNEVRSLGRCLASVIASDYPEDRLEVLVVDGASTDGTRDVIAHWARSHARIRMLENPRRTTPAALNRGIAVASGDVIARLDAHAALTPTYLSRAVEYLETTGGLIKWAA